MKPLHIVLLVAAGAAGGAVIMKLTEPSQPVEEPAIIAEAQPVQPAAKAVLVQQSPAAPAAQPAMEPPPIQGQAIPDQAAKSKPAKIEPAKIEREREAPKPRRVHYAAPAASVARNRASNANTVNTKPAFTATAVAVHVMAIPGTAAAPETAPASVPAPAPTSAPTSTPAPDPAKELAKESAPQPIPPARPEPENVTPPPPPEPHRVTLNAGTLIPVRLVDGLSSERSMPGDTFAATLDKELVADGFVIAERGARVEGRVVAADRGGRVRGVAALSVELTRIHTSDGQNVAIHTDGFEKRAPETHGEDAAKVGAGAAIGAVVGALGGGGKGAAIGAGMGGGAGAGAVLLTRGEPARLASETRVTFRLRTPVTLTERPQ